MKVTEIVVSRMKNKDKSCHEARVSDPLSWKITEKASDILKVLGKEVSQSYDPYFWVWWLFNKNGKQLTVAVYTTKTCICPVPSLCGWRWSSWASLTAAWSTSWWSWRRRASASWRSRSTSTLSRRSAEGNTAKCCWSRTASEVRLHFDFLSLSVQSNVVKSINIFVRQV